MKCPKCNHEMKALFSSWYCDNPSCGKEEILPCILTGEDGEIARLVAWAKARDERINRRMEAANDELIRKLTKEVKNEEK